MDRNYLFFSILVCFIPACTAEIINPGFPVSGKKINSIDLSSSELNGFKVSYSDGTVSDTEINTTQNSVPQYQEPSARKVNKIKGTPSYNKLADHSFPFRASSNQCFAKLQISAITTQEHFNFVKEDASYKFEVEKPQYSWEERKIEISEPEETVQIIPAEYKWINKKIFFDTDKGQVSTTVRKKIMVTPPKLVKKQIPAKYQFVRIKKISKPIEIKRVEIPAVHDKVMVSVEAQQAYEDWRQVLCATHINSDLISRLQNALKNSGYYSGPRDGVLGSQTLIAIKSFQKDNNLAIGQITIEALKKLGVKNY